MNVFQTRATPMEAGSKWAEYQYYFLKAIKPKYRQHLKIKAGKSEYRQHLQILCLRSPPAPLTPTQCIPGAREWEEKRRSHYPNYGRTSGREGQGRCLTSVLSRLEPKMGFC